MRLYDITVPLSVNTPTYPGDPSIEISDWKSLASGDAANVSLLHFGAHSATHVDAPAHFIDGARCVDELPLEVLLGEAQVIELPKDREFIDAEFVSRALEPHATRVLFKTRNSSFWSSNGSEFR
ncbi:MAG TPA: cyclase family protein, partial [Pyrinomonadaceae bacterium]